MLRRPPLKRGAPIARKSRLRPVSKKRARELSVYRVKRERFLAEHDRCEIGPVLHAADITESNCTYSGVEVHHRKRRLGGNLTDESTWLASCPECHRWIETHASTARRLGIIET